jgi:hypothetical protein
VPIYIARYSAFNSMAHKEHGTFFSVLEKNLSDLEAAVAREMVENPGEKANEVISRGWISFWIFFGSLNLVSQ